MPGTPTTAHRWHCHSPPPRSPSTPTRSGSPSPSPSPVPVGPATLHLAFTGILNDKLHGFYRSTFTDDDGVEHVIATTQFEATDARRAFPCWDEPDLKAVFEVTLVVDDGLAAYSNGAGGRGDARARGAGGGSASPTP